MINHFYKEKKQVEMPPREEMIAYIQLIDYQFMPMNEESFENYTDEEIFKMYNLALLNHSYELQGLL